MNLVNKKAKFNYEILEKIEAGIVLTGAEVKAIRAGKVDFSGSHVGIVGNEAFAINLHIGIEGAADSRKTRKILLKKQEILNLQTRKEASGLTLIPLRLYNRRSLIKLEVGLVRGKKTRQKKEAKRARDIERDVERELKENL